MFPHAGTMSGFWTNSERSYGVVVSSVGSPHSACPASCTVTTVPATIGPSRVIVSVFPG